MIDQLLQIWIVLTGAASIWLITDPAGKLNRRGYWIGLAGQPAWIYSTYHHFQWGMLILTAIFTISYLRALLKRPAFPFNQGADIEYL